MGTGDVSQVVETWLAAAAELRLRLRHPATETTAVDRARIAGRIEHLLGTDPAGSWVAVDHDHRVVGLAQSFVRQSYWVLSLLAVDPRLQTSGVGRALLDRAMAHGAGCRGTIQVSMDPRAVRLYTTAGFELHPSMIAWGTLRPDRRELRARCASVTPATSTSSTTSIGRYGAPPGRPTSASWSSTTAPPCSSTATRPMRWSSPIA